MFYLGSFHNSFMGLVFHIEGVSHPSLFLMLLLIFYH